jgi:catechol 2,3-dioxygenase-like lactoylglutathione lyase family enzyme
MNPPFAVQKIGHAVINVADLEKSKHFYTDVLGFKVSDIYADNMMPGGMVFLRCNGDHHCLALIGGAPAADRQAKTLHHLAFELATLDEVFRARDHLKQHGARSSSRAAAAPAARSRSSSSIPTAITSNSTGASTRSAMTAARGRPRSGGRRRAWRTPCASRRPARTRRCTMRRCGRAWKPAPIGREAEAANIRLEGEHRLE